MARLKYTAAELFATQALASHLKKELTEDILPYWSKKICKGDTGFYGRISGEEVIDPEAPVGAIMTSRILWTFSNAFRLFRREEYKTMAMQAKSLIINNFYDIEQGGIYWSINPDGTPLDTKKQIYAIAFCIYGLAEWNRASGDEEALELAKKLYRDIEKHSFDTCKNGYFEAFTREWGEIQDMRLSDKDANESKTMNTHLHVLEAYTGLYRVWKDGGLAAQLKNLIGIFLDRILGADAHLRLFFDDDWNCGYKIYSYGHDIEASWLLHEAALVLGDEATIGKVEKEVPRIAAAAGEGFTAKGGMIYEKDNATGHIDGDRHWWVQAETVVGYFNLWQLTGEPSGLENSIECWEFIRNNLIDRENGEWFWSIRQDGTVNRTDDKAGFWKCPYHNGRMCMEIIERTASMALETK
ncbi:MAG: AGE family epimerase/isomerase [Candidatus Cryptobacteroides sp.]|nr:AGE family epimerase/isomerase [Candidatus Cryptobacteroides sp.]